MNAHKLCTFQTRDEARAYLATFRREDILSGLQENDLNGSYTDEAAERAMGEAFEPISKAHAIKLALDVWEDCHA